MINSPLTAQVAFRLGPVPITEPVVTTWGLIAALTLSAALMTRGLRSEPSKAQAVLELIVATVEDQIRETLRTDPGPYLPFLATLFIFIACANLLALAPGLEPPTAHLETDAALAVIVFFAVHYFGLRALGWRGYFAQFARPTWVMLPLNVVSEITRTFSLMVRLFGNIMSGVFVIGVVLSLVGLFVPIPFMALELLTGLIQAYIFTVLAMVFIGGAVEPSRPSSRSSRMNYIPLVSILAAAFAVGMGAIGPALAEGRAIAAAMDAIARQPDAAGVISRTLFVGLAMIETMAIYALVIALLVLFVNPFAH